ncbi:MAG: hypothetical protein ABFD79_14420 [Phycisphaerales bacterium]
MEKNIEKVEKILGEPFATDFSDYVRKIRNGLIITSVISLSLLLGNLQITSDSSFLGLKFNGLSQALILKALFFLNTYMFIHFFWCSIDRFQEWRLRVTGTRVAFVTTGMFSSEECDYPNDPRQSTLYNWWKDESKKMSSLQEPLKHIEEKLRAWEMMVKNELEGKNSNVVNACMSINQVVEDVRKLTQSVERASNSIESKRIPASLKRFDSSFQLFLQSQNLRWLIVELGFPLILGVCALTLLAIRVL